MLDGNITYLVAEAACKESTEAGPSPAVDMDNKCDLDSISLVNENEVVVRPECEQDTTKVAVGKVVFRDMLLDNESFLGQGCSYPLRYVSL